MKFNYIPDPDDTATVVSYPGVGDVAHFPDYESVLFLNANDSEEAQNLTGLILRAKILYERRGWNDQQLFDSIISYITRNTGEEPEQFEATYEELVQAQLDSLGVTVTGDPVRYYLYFDAAEVIGLIRVESPLQNAELRMGEGWFPVDTDEEFGHQIANLEVTEEAVEYYDAAVRGGETSRFSEYAEFML